MLKDVANLISIVLRTRERKGHHYILQALHDWASTDHEYGQLLQVHVQCIGAGFVMALLMYVYSYGSTNYMNTSSRCVTLAANLKTVNLYNKTTLCFETPIKKTWALYTNSPINSIPRIA